MQNKIKTQHKKSTIYEGNNKQRINNNRTTDLERTAAKADKGLNAFYWPALRPEFCCCKNAKLV